MRYVDDMALSSNSRAELENWHAQLTDWLQRRLRLRLHGAHVQPVYNGVPWLGFVVTAKNRRVKSRKVVFATRKLKGAEIDWRNGRLNSADFTARVQGWSAHVKHGDTKALRFRMMQRLFDRRVF